MTDYLLQDTGHRETVLRQVRRVVIKVGTRLLTDVQGVSKGERVTQLVAEIDLLRRQGLEIILVSSGAIGAGMTVLGSRRRPQSLPALQAHAATGQCRLMYLYESACVLHDFHCGQLLLTAADLQDRERQLNVANCIQALLAKGILPVINENDSVSVDEIRFGDNDVLAALTAAMVRADLTVLLTSVDGLRVREAEGFGHRISVVEHLSDGVWAMAGDTDGNPFSTGGMRSKLRAADVVNRAGEPLWIADGSDFSALRQVFAGADIGTLFTATVTNGRMRSRKRFLAFFSEPAGDVEVDAGAARALRFAGKSLLPSGVRDVRGVFSRGDTVRILDNTGQELGRGVTNYASSELQRIRGCQTADIRRILGHDAYPEVAHRDFLVITAGPEPQEDSQP